MGIGVRNRCREGGIYNVGHDARKCGLPELDRQVSAMLALTILEHLLRERGRARRLRSVSLTSLFFFLNTLVLPVRC